MTAPIVFSRFASPRTQTAVRPDDQPAPVADGLALTLWAADGLRTAVAAARPRLAAVSPDIVQLHAGPQGLAEHAEALAADVRALLPAVRLWVGVAWDGWVDDVAAGANVDSIVRRVYIPAARAAVRARAELLVINSEAAGKQHPRAARRLTVAAIDAIREECPGLDLGITAYDHPDFHDEEPGNGRIDADDEGYPWSAAHGGPVARAVHGLLLPKTGRVELALPQRYAAPAKDPVTGKQPVAKLGALSRRIASSQKSWERATIAGWIDPSMPVRPYIQAHHTDPRDIVRAIVEHDVLAMWAAPTRIDAAGWRAAEVGMRIRHGVVTSADLSGPEAALYAAGFQAVVGASADGAWGADSTRRARLWLAAAGIDGDGSAESIRAVVCG